MDGDRQGVEGTPGGAGIPIGGGRLGDQTAIWPVLEGGLVKRFDLRAKDCRLGIDEPAFSWYGLGEIVDVEGYVVSIVGMIVRSSPEPVIACIRD